MEYDEKSARERVTRNGGKITQGIITVKRPGLKVLSAIDYLMNHCKGYYWFPATEDGGNGKT